MTRHSWGEPFRTPHRTDRAYKRCGIVKVTRHEPGMFPRQEFERDGAAIPGRETPRCEEKSK